ncbi:MAG: shikimate dehydrogenase, partial [Bacteroidales bacterium]|nr:shikimate dehydrogenase [Bacteroidales bacterium]
FLDEMDEAAKNIGAVNTIKIFRENGFRLKGYNTDAYGFHHSLLPFLKEEHHSALILGTGGASKAVAYVFKELGIDCLFVSRTPKNKEHIRYEDLTRSIIQHYLIIVNTSPLGMYPNTSAFPEIPYEYIEKNHILYDLVYNPEVTQFLEKGRGNGATVLNGLKMLHLQAEKAWEIWNE